MARWAGWAVLLAIAMVDMVSGSAATVSLMDALSDDAARDPADTVDVGAVRPIATPVQPSGKAVQHGNPLWSVPLSLLTSAQERPIFSASRRPQPRVVAAAPVIASPPSKLVEVPLSLVLVGVVVGQDNAIAIILDRTDQRVVRMRQGDSRGGWSLKSIQPREVTFKQGDRSEVIALQRAELAASVPALSAVPTAPRDANNWLGVPNTGASFSVSRAARRIDE